MKRVTASQARRNWFRLLDEVAAGEVVVIERKGRRIVLRREEQAEAESARPLPDYGSVLRAPDADRADRWRWTWPGPEEHLVLRDEPSDEAGDRAAGEGGSPSPKESGEGS